MRFPNIFRCHWIQNYELYGRLIRFSKDLFQLYVLTLLPAFCFLVLLAAQKKIDRLYNGQDAYMGIVLFR